MELPDWLRAFVIVGKYGATYLPVATDENGQLYIVLTGSPEVTIPGTVDTNDLNTVKQIQGTDGTVYRTAKLDANGQFIMVPRGQSGNYMAVDASGFLSAILKGQKPDASLGNVAMDASGQLIMVPRGSNGNYMSVDASGYLTTILKGLYGSTLATIAVDASGRMIGLIADADDVWGSGQMMGLAEAVSRLGGVQRWDTRGRVLDAVTFDNGIPTQLNYSKPAAATVTTDPLYALTGGYCAKIVTDTVNASQTQILRYLRTNPQGKIGLEISIATSETNVEIALWIMRDNTSHTYWAQLRWDISTNTLYISSAVGGDVTLSSTAKGYATNKVYNHLKLVVDMTTGKFVRALWNEQSFDLSAYSMTDYGAVADTFLEVIAEVKNKSAAAHTVYLDHIVTTYAEPT